MITENPITFHVPNSSFLNQAALKSVDTFAANHSGLPIMETFLSYEGEGLKIGTPRILIRLGGCPIRCHNCDTPQSFVVKESRMQYVSVGEAFQMIRELSYDSEGNRLVNEVSITGGEPMMYPERITELAELLKGDGFSPVLETSGLIIDEEVFSKFDYVSLDIKAPSTKVQVSEANINAIYEISKKHKWVQVKVVISNKADLDWVLEHLPQFLSLSNKHPLILTPNSPFIKHGKQSPQKYWETMEMIVKWNKGYNIVAIPQIHKLVGLR